LKRLITLIGVAFITACTLGGLTASSSFAACLRTTESGTGNYMAGCMTKEINGNWILTMGALEVVNGLPAGSFCAETEEPNVGNYMAQCLVPEATAQHIRVKLGAGAFVWVDNGKVLEQGKKQVNISSAQGEPELKGKVALLGAWISCKSAVTQNAYIEGDGINSGQGSASNITFEKCTTHEPAKCIVNEPIKTKQVKSRLVEYTNSAKQLKTGELFEPSQGETYVEISFKKGAEKCAIEGEVFPVKGSVVANVFPEDQESLNGYLTFPKEPITAVKSEGQEREVGLTLGGVASTFSGIFESKLASGEKWGAFE
jgi:hypothetical protein